MKTSFTDKRPLFKEDLIMEDKKSQLLKLILKENISAIVTMSEKLDAKPSDVISMINTLLSTGELEGSLTEDGSRFFKSSVKVSAAPLIHREEEPPKFLSYNARPGKVIAVIGFLVLIGGVIINAIASNADVQNFAAILMLIGLPVFLIGLYLIARRGTPD
jgi:hypothetical protein